MSGDNEINFKQLKIIEQVASTFASYLPFHTNVAHFSTQCDFLFHFLTFNWNSFILK